MPRKSTSERKEYNIEFVECDLKAADKPHFEGWADEVYSDLDTLLSDLMHEGYRVTIKFDFNNSCFTASMTQQDVKHINAGKLLSARGEFPLEVLSMVLYKHIVKLQNDDWPVLRQRELWG